ncbi:3-demethylubiquinone-9 3-methyltransferase [Candidatus Koribacter versatilis Ellin345]|uniref:3-demethylubiquinone-9 3-methyltransferase n=1 Tax=Koribacter versatilis (strain Ellin345) TaxID=204669 RepID=Q1IRP7_KORVE|nr:VOC family protein [Candidatus Koribacter versatilis]ABF40453.1 3-demethylubiquinone-9 3-methyltransferase [Candidatus Koribacter versatilis Ellin345]
MNPFESSTRITPFLWFDENAEEAVEFYCSIFKNARRIGELHADGAPHTPKGKPLTVTFELDGQRFTALNGGPYFKFTEAVSFAIRCDSQAEVDEYWSKLTADGGQESQCGWLKDKYGLSWQVVPKQLPELIKNPKAMQAMMGMKKIELGELEKAAKS